MEDMRKIHLVNLSTEIDEDIYEEGDGESTGCGIGNMAIGKTFDDMSAAVKYLAANFGLSDDVNDYNIDEDNRTIQTSRSCANHSEAQNGGWFDPTEDEYKQWREGKIKLYSETYYVNFIFTC